MAQTIIFSCDHCGKEIKPNPAAGEYKDCKGTSVSLEVNYSGFCTAGSQLGSFREEHDAIFCKSCTDSLFSKIKKFIKDFGDE